MCVGVYCQIRQNTVYADFPWSKNNFLSAGWRGKTLATDFSTALFFEPPTRLNVRVSALNPMKWLSLAVVLETFVFFMLFFLFPLTFANDGTLAGLWTNNRHIEQRLERGLEERRGK